MNIKEMIANAKDCVGEKVPVPEWGVDLYVKRFSLGEIIGQDIEPNDKEGILKLFCMGVADEDGNAIFAFPADRELLLSKSFDVVKRVAEKVASFNGLSDAEKN